MQLREVAGGVFWVETLQSLDRFSDLEADVIIPGHGEPWRGHPREAVAQARKLEGG